jgi:hypothetical protein
MKLEENRPHGFQVSSPQAKAWVLLLHFFLGGLFFTSGEISFELLRLIEDDFI